MHYEQHANAGEIPSVPSGLLSADDLQEAVNELQTSINNIVLNVKDYGAVGNGVANDYAAIAATITAVEALGGGTVYLPAGTYKVGTTLTFANTKVTLLGANRGTTTINYTGSGKAIYITAAQNIILRGFTIDGSGASASTDGIVQEYTAATTGNRYQFVELLVQNFPRDGVVALNIEHTKFEEVWSVTNGRYGFNFDNTSHTGAALGISNVATRCRAQSNAGTRGWLVSHQAAFEFIACQSFGNGTGQTTDAQFELSGSTRACQVRAVDVENPQNSSAGYGLLASGVEHALSVDSFSLDQGVRLSSASNCIVLPGKYSTVTTGVLLTSGCSKNFIFRNVNVSVTDQSAQLDNVIFGYQGILFPRSATADRPTASSTGGEGKLLYDTTLHRLIASDGTYFRSMGHTGADALMPTGVIAETFPRSAARDNVTPLSSGRESLSLVWLPAGYPVASIAFFAGTTPFTAGSTTNNKWFSLRNSSRALLAYTTDDGATAWGANTKKTLAIAKDNVGGTISSYTTTYEGWHYIGIMVSAVGGSGAVPTLLGHICSNSAIWNDPPILYGVDATNTGLTTTPPDPSAALTAGSNAPYGQVL